MTIDMDIRYEMWDVDGVEYPAQIVSIGNTVTVFVDGEVIDTWKLSDG